VQLVHPEEWDDGDGEKLKGVKEEVREHERPERSAQEFEAEEGAARRAREEPQAGRLAECVGEPQLAGGGHVAHGPAHARRRPVQRRMRPR
jgi:hypothetical protein